MRWTVSVMVQADVTEAEVWPDGDGPDNPTAADVEAAIAKAGLCLDACAHGGFSIPNEPDVVVT